LKTEDETLKAISLRLCQQKWLRMGNEPMPGPTRYILWHSGRGNP